MEERLEYYRRKYGEDFELTDSTSGGGSGPSDAERSPSSRQGDAGTKEGNTEGSKETSVWRKITRMLGGGDRE
jgi:hypothetical protein